MTPPDEMTILQNRWYNGVTSALSADRHMAQIIQPSPPLDHTDLAVWGYENLIPPPSLTFNTRLVASERFFDDYSAVVTQMDFPETSFEQDIGAAVYQAWQAYVSQLQPPPTPDQLPEIFSEWALQEAPSVSQVGASDLSTMALISAAKQSLDPYLGIGGKPADFSGGFAELNQSLQLSHGLHWSFTSDQSGDVSDTWTSGQNTSFYGLWADSASSSSNLTKQFAQNRVTVDTSIDAYTVWPITPGPWYQSWLLNLAFTSQSSPPWPNAPDPTWVEAFGPDGFLVRLLASLLIADGIHVTVTSETQYSGTDRNVIISQIGSGLWPFFVPSNPNIVTNTVTFNTTGMELTCTAAQGNPVVIGANVLDIGQYLGHG